MAKAPLIPLRQGFSARIAEFALHYRVRIFDEKGIQVGSYKISKDAINSNMPNRLKVAKLALAQHLALRSPC